MYSQNVITKRQKMTEKPHSFKLILQKTPFEKIFTKNHPFNTYIWVHIFIFMSVQNMFKSVQSQNGKK